MKPTVNVKSALRGDPAMSPAAPVIRAPYQDPALAVEQRVEDLLQRLTLRDKAGLMFHTMAIPADPELQLFGAPSVASMIRDRNMNHFNVLGALAMGDRSHNGTTRCNVSRQRDLSAFR